MTRDRWSVAALGLLESFGADEVKLSAASSATGAAVFRFTFQGARKAVPAG